MNFEEWTPNHLKDVELIAVEKRISKSHIYGSFLGTAVWATIYFNAEKLIGIYETIDGELLFVMPALNQESLMAWSIPVVIVLLVQVALSFYKLLQGKWTKKLALFETFYEIMATVIFIGLVSSSTFFNPDFIVYLANVFDMANMQLERNFIFGIIGILMLSLVLNIYNAWKKHGRLNICLQKCLLSRKIMKVFIQCSRNGLNIHFAHLYHY